MAQGSWVAGIRSCPVAEKGILERKVKDSIHLVQNSVKATGRP